MSLEGAEPPGCPVGHPYQLSAPCSKGEGKSLERLLLKLQLGWGGPSLLPCLWIVYYYYFEVFFVN
jgi:hypothetical protein